MSYKEIKRKVLFDVLDKYPDVPNLTAARILFRDHPEFFDSIEQARSIIRYYRGAKGDVCRKALVETKYLRNET